MFLSIIVLSIKNKIIWKRILLNRSILLLVRNIHKLHKKDKKISVDSLYRVSLNEVKNLVVIFQTLRFTQSDNP